MRKIVCFLRYLPQKMFELMLSFSASAYVVAIYLIQKKAVIPQLPQNMQWISYIVYLLIPVLIARLWLWLSKHMPACGIDCEICEVELASHAFLPNYLGYFFVALGISNTETFLYVYILIWLFTHLSQALSFNPLFLLFGYQFYFVTGKDGTKIFLITKQSMKSHKDAELTDLRRINDFTFIDMR